MQEKLVIWLHAHDLSRPSWAIIDAQSHATKVTEKGDPSELVAIAKNHQIIVIVPSEDVLLTDVTLPKMNRSRLLQAIPYALEEQVIEDVETMHFAAGDYQANQILPVAVTSRNKMKEWMTLLQSWNITPDTLIPGVFALPLNVDSWTACVDEMAVVRTGTMSGFACDPGNLGEMLIMALSAALSPPQEIQVNYLQGAVLNLSLPIPVRESEISSTQLFETMSLAAVGAPSVNLLQGEFQNKKSRRMPQMTSVLKIGAYLFLFWLALLFLYPIISFTILSSRANAVHAEIAAIYKKQFPNASSVVAPKERMQQKLNKSSSDLGDNRLLLIMANVGKGLSLSSGVQLKRMDFASNVMTLEISAVSSDIFSTFTDALTRQGMRVKQQNANLSGTRVSATLQIE
jgi:general secretion pathway protein L